MTAKPIKNMAASVHTRLLNAAKESARPFNELLQYYAIERFLYRLSKSEYVDHFVLKGALTMLVWRTPVTRPTRDIDLLAKIANDLESVRSVIAAVCQQPVDSDGLVFDPGSVVTEHIAEDADYHGVRAKFRGGLGNARIAMQIDIGFSDVVTPAPENILFPTILDLPAARLRAYTRETVVAEKFEAMVKLGVLNSRMKDFFDIWLLSRNYEFNGEMLAKAIARTFEKRGTASDADPVCFSIDFAQSASKATQWKAFLRNARLADVQTEFPEVIDQVRRFLRPVAESLAARSSLNMIWRPPGPWMP